MSRQGVIIKAFERSGIEQVKEIADTVSGYYLKIPLEAFDQAQDEIEKLKSLGIDMF